MTTKAKIVLAGAALFLVSVLFLPAGSFNRGSGSEWFVGWQFFTDWGSVGYSPVSWQPVFNGTALLIEWATIAVGVATGLYIAGRKNKD